jgi:hypothetical protein
MTDLLAQLEDVCRSGDGWAHYAAHADPGCQWQEIINALGVDASGPFDVRGCGWEARFEKTGAYKSWIDAAYAITAKVTS